jgi:hypothetical protein
MANVNAYAQKDGVELVYSIQHYPVTCNIPKIHSNILINFNRQMGSSNKNDHRWRFFRYQ